MPNTKYLKYHTNTKVLHPNNFLSSLFDVDLTHCRLILMMMMNLNTTLLSLVISRYRLGSLEFNRGVGKLQSALPKRGHLPSPGRINQHVKHFKTSPPSLQANSSSACACAPGYTGRTCNLPSTSCAQTPCLHNAPCTDEPGSGAGYTCDCDGTGHSGAHCQMELNHCAGSPCAPGVCLPQPGGFLCECGPDHTGSTCANKRDLGARAGSRNLDQVRHQQQKKTK